MMRSVYKKLVGQSPLPAKVIDRIGLVAFADANHVLGQMAHQIREDVSGGLLDVCNNAKLRAAHDHAMLTFELERLERAMAGLDIRIVVLKGGAYVARGMKAADGRRVSDLDILVARDDIGAVEERLLHAGWQADEQTDNEYDQQYYRKHMHELPPLRHRSRGTILDVHHALLPPTSRYYVDTDKMFAEAVQLPGRKLWTFTPVDIFIHSAVHAYADGAVDAPVRTLVEQYLLFQDLSVKERSTLLERARNVGARSAVAIALWLIGTLFDDQEAKKASIVLQKPLRHFFIKLAVVSKASDGAAAPLAKGYLYIRSHYLRMPMHLLLPHLIKKAMKWRPLQQQEIELPKP